MASERVDGPVRALSVRGLVRRRLGVEEDAWYLALVQRDEKWDQVRMRYLLDSLLAGYPIGTLLVCQVREQALVMRLGDSERVVVEAEAADWQLLDGQQRINALSSMLTSTGRYGRFFLHMGVERPPAKGPVTGRGARDEGLGYIHWLDGSEADEAVPDRAFRLDLSRWYDWAEGDGGERIARAAALPEGDAQALLVALNEIDPDFTDDPAGLDLGVALDRLTTLIALWREPTIPVEYRVLGSPMDVLEVFTRVNRAGVMVAGQDLFFAAVKTLWRDAEQVVARTTEALTPRRGEAAWDPLVDRMSALRLLARLAARIVLRADMVPLAIDRLTGERGRQLIDVMRGLAAPGSPALRRMSVLMGVVAERSGLGFGLYSVDQRLWDPVLAWAAVHPAGDDPAVIEQSLPAIDAFLLGATSFRWAGVLGDRFARLAMTEGLAAGVAGEPFPVDRLPPVARSASATLQGGRDSVHGIESDDDRLRWADGNAPLLLAVLQQIPFRPQRNVFDWDHIYPQAKATLMWVPGPDGRYRRHHPYRRFVGSAGNFWGLDAGTNRAMQDDLPGLKFQKIRAIKAGGERPVWPEERWWLGDAEIEAFARVGEQLENQEIEPAMQLFHDTVVSRTLGMVAEVLRRMPDVARFAATADVGSTDPRPEPAIAPALGIAAPEPAPEPIAPLPPGATDDRVAGVLARADQFGSGPAVRDFVARAMALGLHVRGYKYNITITPPTTRSISIVALTPRDNPPGVVETWVAPDVFAAHFPELPRERFIQKLSGIRGTLLSPAEIEALAANIEAALRPEGD